MSLKNRPSQNISRLAITFLTCLAFAFFAYSPATMQEGVRGRSENGDLECVSYCSTDRPGTVLMEVKLRLVDGPVNETQLRSRIRQQGLEATVYADGFERGLFASVAAIQPRALFRARATTTQSRIPGLENLVVTRVGTRFDASSQLLRLIKTSSGAESQGEWVITLLEGLDPGMAYTFRAPLRRSVVTCQAVVCPVDRPAPTPRP